MKLHLKNFQSISDAEIEIGPLTVLVGQSDVGKSAVIRALYLLHRNQGGLELVKHGKSKLEISQYLDNGTRVSIFKGKGLNNYFSGDKTFCKIGRDVPDEVSRALRTQELVLDKDQTIDLNFSRQFDTPFLLADSTTVITKAVSSLSGINIIYAAIREGTSEHQKAKVRAEVLQDTIQELSRYDALSEEMSRVSKLIADAKGISLDWTHLCQEQRFNTTLLDRLSEENAKTIDLTPQTVKLESILTSWDTLSRLRADKSSKELLLSKIQGLSPYVMTEGYAEDLRSCLAHLGGTALIERALDTSRETSKTLTALLFKIQETDDNASSIATTLAKYEADIVSLEKQVKVCPTCQRPL